MSKVNRLKVAELDKLSHLVGALKGVVEGSIGVNTAAIYKADKAFSNYFETLCGKYKTPPSRTIISLKTGDIRVKRDTHTPKKVVE